MPWLTSVGWPRVCDGVSASFAEPVTEVASPRVAPGSCYEARGGGQAMLSRPKVQSTSRSAPAQKDGKIRPLHQRHANSIRSSSTLGNENQSDRSSKDWRTVGKGADKEQAARGEKGRDDEKELEGHPDRQGPSGREREAQDPLGEAAIPPKAQAFHLRDGQATLKPETFKESVPPLRSVRHFAEFEE